MRIFAAERAFLFLTDPDHDDRLTPYLGRDSDGGEIDQLTGYGSTLVDRVRDTGEALVVTGSDEGAALGSQSAVVHGLRSIMVAPMMVNNRVQGVVYLDSRAARGIFTTDDTEILVAITNQVASALETARAAQLEIAVRTANRDRDIAQTLHAAMTDVGGTLDPNDVAGRLVDTVSRVIRVDRVALLRTSEDGETTITATVDGTPAGVVDSAGTHGAAGTGADPALAAALAAAVPWYGPADRDHVPPAILGEGVTAWLVAPVTVRDTRQGVLVLGTTDDRALSAADAEMAMALAGQGAVALENAVLFRAVEDLATIDSLTGLFNRRHFFDVTGPLVSGQQRHGRPLTAIMVDIDNFKKVNDTHGHFVGDEIIREIGRRLADLLRVDDILCRYGGEEFAAVLPDTGLADAVAAARRMHAAIRQRPVDTTVGPLLVTASIGVSGPASGLHDIAAMLKSADDALYVAKRAGRDQVASAEA